MPYDLSPRFENDYLTEHGARKLCHVLNKYWHDRGYIQVNHTPVRTHPSVKDGLVIYIIQSNLINGLPPDDTGNRPIRRCEFSCLRVPK